MFSNCSVPPLTSSGVVTAPYGEPLLMIFCSPFAERKIISSSCFADMLPTLNPFRSIVKLPVMVISRGRRTLLRSVTSLLVSLTSA